MNPLKSEFFIAMMFGACLTALGFLACRQPTSPQEKPIICDSVCNGGMGRP